MLLNATKWATIVDRFYHKSTLQQDWNLDFSGAWIFFCLSILSSIFHVNIPEAYFNFPTECLIFIYTFFLTTESFKRDRQANPQIALNFKRSRFLNDLSQSSFGLNAVLYALFIYLFYSLLLLISNARFIFKVTLRNQTFVGFGIFLFYNGKTSL